MIKKDIENFQIKRVNLASIIKGLIIFLSLSSIFIFTYRETTKRELELELELKKTKELADTYAKAYRDQRERYIQRVKYDREELVRLLKERDKYHANNLREVLKERAKRTSNK